MSARAGAKTPANMRHVNEPRSDEYWVGAKDDHDEHEVGRPL